MIESKEIFDGEIHFYDDKIGYIGIYITGEWKYDEDIIGPYLSNWSIKLADYIMKNYPLLAMQCLATHKSVCEALNGQVILRPPSIMDLERKYLLLFKFERVKGDKQEYEGSVINRQIATAFFSPPVSWKI